MISFEQSLLSAFVVWLFCFNWACNTHWIATGPIEQRKLPLNSTSKAFGGAKHKKKRYYIIVGGSGFKGSWIARYLQARGEVNVYIFDRDCPPDDVLKYGARWVQVDLTESVYLEKELMKVSSLMFGESKAIIYNCSIVKQLGLPNFRADLGVHASEMLYVALRSFPPQSVILIHIGDTLSHRLPVRNWDRLWPSAPTWCQTASSDFDIGFGPGAESKEDRQDRSFSSYAWHQLHVEAMTLRASTYNPSVAAAAVLRIEGFPSGHLGDGLLSPVLQKGRVFLHSPNVPISLVNIEDVARACLSLERLLMDPSTRESTNARQFTIGSTEVTTWKDIFDYCNRRRKLLVINVPPALVYVLTWIMGFVYTGKPSSKKSPRDTPLALGLSRLTYNRFYTLQVGQVPNPQNQERQQHVLGVTANYSLSQTLDGLLHELVAVNET